MSGIIAIDGPAGVGKSTLARLLAKRLDLPYLDTGAMFRFLALKLGGLDLPPAELARRAREWQFSLAGSGANTRLLINGEAIGAGIRTEEAARLASELGKKPEIRAILRDAQRALGEHGALVAEGRDMGTVVFPHAARKFFLDATPEARAKRRWLEGKDSGADLAAIAHAIAERDAQDRSRAIAPLRPAADALVIDTSYLSIPEVLEKMLVVVPH